jgi:DNA helicase HerA-like ATPase
VHLRPRLGSRPVDRIAEHNVTRLISRLAERVTSRIESRGLERLREPDAGMFAGRSMLVVDEAWKLVERRAAGEWVNDIARRSRHLGLFLVAISQQLSDFAGPYACMTRPWR